MDLVLNAPKERMDIVLKSLYEDLDRIVWSYENFYMIYVGCDLRGLWHTSLAYLKNGIEVQLKKTQEANDEYKEALNSFEMTPFNGLSKERLQYWKCGLNNAKMNIKLRKQGFRTFTPSEQARRRKEGYTERYFQAYISEMSWFTPYSREIL